MLCWAVEGSSWFNMWCSLRPAEMPCAPHTVGWRRYLGRPHRLSLWGVCGFPDPHRWGFTAQWGPRTPGSLGIHLHIPIQPEEDLKPDDAVRVGVITTDLLDIQWQIPPIPLGVWTAHPDVLSTSPGRWRAPSSHPQRSQLDITSLASMEMITVRKSLTSKFKCHYRHGLSQQQPCGWTHLGPGASPVLTRN